MAASYSDMGTICNQPDFQHRVSVAMGVAAVNIYSEVGTTPGHAARAAFATKVVNGNYSLPSVCYALMQSAAIQAAALLTVVGNGVADTDIQNQVNAIWNALAGHNMANIGKWNAPSAHLEREWDQHLRARREDSNPPRSTSPHRPKIRCEARPNAYDLRVYPAGGYERSRAPFDFSTHANVVVPRRWRVR